MTQKISIEILTADRIGHLFLEYILRKNIPAKIGKEVDKKIYLITEIRDEKYDKRLKTEYYKWAKQKDIPSDLIESGWESYYRD